MSGTAYKIVIEHLIGVISTCENRDLDWYDYEELNGIIHDLENFQTSYCNEDDLRAVCGLVATIISHLYVARGHAIPIVPRDFEYYQQMNAIRSLIQTIKRMR